MTDNCNINNLAKNQVSAIFHSRAIRRTVLPKFTELCMETPCWCPSGWAPIWRPETKRNICHWVLLQKRKFISRGTQKQYSTTFFNTRTVQMAKFPEISLGISHFLTSSSVMLIPRHEKLRNSSVVYRKTKNPFGTTICMDISLQLLLYIIEVIYREDQ